MNLRLVCRCGKTLRFSIFTASAREFLGFFRAFRCVHCNAHPDEMTLVSSEIIRGVAA